MFERYTEKARRVIFFARYEASQFGSLAIETEHLLLGVIREDKAFRNRFLPGTHGESIRQQIEAATTKGEYISTSVDLPLSNESKQVLGYADEEAERLSHRHIGTEHLVLGLLREESTFACRLLHEHGVRISAVREYLAKAPVGPAVVPEAEPSQSAPGFTVDLTQQAAGRHLHPIVGRDKEIDRLIHILGRSTKKNAALVGEPGVGKRSVVEGLAQRIADGNAPSFLADKTIVELDIAGMVKATPGSRAHFGGQHTILFTDELFALLAAEAWTADPLKTALLGGSLQCICAATPEDYRKAREKHRWLDRCFRPIEVQPPGEEATLAILFSEKDRLEMFHSVTYSDDAIRAAAHYADVYVKDRCLPDKALDLMDEAGAYVNSRPVPWPPDIIEARKRIKEAYKNVVRDVANHEFEKARLHSDEELRERNQLRDLLKKHGIPETEAHQVTRADVEEVLARWTGIPVSTIRQRSPGA